MTLDCIVIDDEPLAINLVEKFIKKIPYLRLIAAFESSFEALNSLKTIKVDILFLDINMPDISGIQFIKTIQQPPMVIFTTAYEKYALESYELNAVDYLLKPFSYERFLKAVDKAHSLKLLSNKNTEAEAEKNNVTIDTQDFIFVKSEHNLIKIDLEDIMYIESIKDYLKIQLESQKHPILTINTLKNITTSLDATRFVRVHRSFIISLRKIKSIRRGRISIGDTEIPIGDLYSQAFYKQVGLNTD
jgi:DNA-binding LytR/AlgR family response regulator